MATIELAPITDHLDESQLAAMREAIRETSDKELDLSTEEDSQIVSGNIDDDLFVDFRDRLEANDLDADLYIPVDFEDVLRVADLRVGSTYSLQLVLDSLREDFLIEDPTDSETEMDEAEDDFERDIDEEDEAASYYDDENGGIEMKDESLRYVWRLLYKAANASLAGNLSLFLHD